MAIFLPAGQWKANGLSSTAAATLALAACTLASASPSCRPARTGSAGSGPIRRLRLKRRDEFFSCADFFRQSGDAERRVRKETGFVPRRNPRPERRPG